jgi:signal transduction histidine kinase
MLRTVTPLPGWRRRLCGAFASLPAGEEERAQLAANLRVSLVAGAVGSGLGAVSNLLAGMRSTPLVLGVLCAVCGLGLWLVHRGRVLVAAAIALPGMVAAIDVLLVLGLGIHDRAALLLPVVILVAALALHRWLLLGTTALCVLSAMAVVRAQQTGLLPVPVGESLGWITFADTTIILVITAVAAHLLVADVVRSLAARRDSERRLEATNRELAARNAELERFTYVVSHDLKSPLVTIRGFLSYVERDTRAGDLSRLEADTRRIRAATDRMSQLLEDLLELSRTGRIDRPHEDVPFEEVVREARSLAEGALSARSVRVEVEGPLPVVRGDRRRLVDLVQNLLDNAAKFMGESTSPEVRIGTREEGAGPGLVTLCVRDNGIGIDPAYQARVFELFHRLDPHVEGTGLGLALARRIVETHGGRIWVESQGAGRGSTLCFSLPAVRSEA